MPACVVVSGGVEDKEGAPRTALEPRSVPNCAPPVLAQDWLSQLVHWIMAPPTSQVCYHGDMLIDQRRESMARFAANLVPVRPASTSGSMSGGGASRSGGESGEERGEGEPSTSGRAQGEPNPHPPLHCRHQPHPWAPTAPEAGN